VPRDNTSASVVGQVLCGAREEAGLTQEEVAARANMDRSYISDVERGIASLSVDRLLRICDALGISAASVIGRIEQRRTGPIQRSRKRTPR
jgi:transcriptional regulator with XRE-family HTH domain